MKQFLQDSPTSAPPGGTTTKPWSAGLALLFCFGLLLLIGAVYSPVTHNAYVDYDDTKYVYDSRVVNGLTLEGIGAAFAAPVDANWIPLTLVSFMVEASLFGTSPAATHWINVALHCLNSVLLWLLLRRLTGSDARSAMVAAIFALHPLRVESVAWAAERKDVLSACLWFLTLHAYVWFSARRTAIRYLLLLLLFTMGLLTKSMLVTLPVVLLLVDFWPLRRVDLPGGLTSGAAWQQVALEKLPLLLPAVVVAVVTLQVQDSGGALNIHDGNLLYQNVANAVMSLFIYLRQFFVPSGLAFFYPPVQWAVWQWGLALLFLAGVTVLVFRWRHMPYLIVGWLWYLVTALPVIGLIRVGAHAHADRYTYIPLVGVTVMVVWGVADVCGNSRDLRRLAAIGAMVAVGACALLTFRQVPHWQDSMALYQRALSVTDNNWLAHNNLAVLHIRSQQFASAEEHLAESLRIRPEYDEALLNMAHLLRIQGRPEEASSAFRKAVDVSPRSAKAIYQFGVHLVTCGDLVGAQEMQLRLAALDPQSASALGDMLKHALSRGQ